MTLEALEEQSREKVIPLSKGNTIAIKMISRSDLSVTKTLKVKNQHVSCESAGFPNNCKCLLNLPLFFRLT